MPSQDDAVEISSGKVSKKRKFDQRDFAHIAEEVIDEYNSRKARRKNREKQWAEIDRQCEMEPNTDFKKMPNGKIDTKKAWMAEMELPLQAQALEILTADARRLMFPRGPWFKAHGEMTDTYLETNDFKSFILGDKAEVPSQLDQDNVDKLIEGFLIHQFRQYDFRQRYDKINAETFKYGMGIGRARVESKGVYIHEAMGTRKETQNIPVLVPVSVKNVYLDDAKPSTHSSYVLGESHIIEDSLKLEKVQLAANKGSADPDDEDGGWMPAAVNGLVADDNGYVKLLEMEGDFIVPRKTVSSLILPGAIVTVAVGGTTGGNTSKAVIRFRWRKTPFSSFLLHPYHYEGATEVYPTSPLMKGRTIQVMATDALNHLMNSSALKNAPPVGYDSSDQAFAQTGGPEIAPYAMWDTMEQIKVYGEVGGDQSALAGTLSLAISLHSDMLGILPSRIGAQTVSHTTAFAKDAELERGASRTVDYVDQAGMGPLTRWLGISYHLARNEVKGKIAFFIDSYGGFVEINKAALPERASFEWFGAAGPREQQQMAQKKLNSLQLALQMDQLKVAQGQPPTINIEAAQREALRDGGWTDIDVITNAAPASSGPAAAPGVSGVADSNPGAATVALQNLGRG